MRNKISETAAITTQKPKTETSLPKTIAPSSNTSTRQHHAPYDSKLYMHPTKKEVKSERGKQNDKSKERKTINEAMGKVGGEKSRAE